MYICIDTQHFPGGARVAAAVFPSGESSVIVKEYVMETGEAEPYRPGQLFRRELPGILQLLSEVEIAYHTAIIDGYVWLSPGRQPGLGAHLFNALDQKVPVIGVAKNPFRYNPASQKVFRGGSIRPLYVSAEGLEEKRAASFVASMYGPHRLPTIIKYVDRLSRTPLRPPN